MLTVVPLDCNHGNALSGRRTLPPFYSFLLDAFFLGRPFPRGAIFLPLYSRLPPPRRYPTKLHGFPAMGKVSTSRPSPFSPYGRREPRASFYRRGMEAMPSSSTSRRPISSYEAFSPTAAPPPALVASPSGRGSLLFPS